MKKISIHYLTTRMVSRASFADDLLGTRRASVTEELAFAACGA